MSFARSRPSSDLPTFAVETQALTKVYPARHKQPERKALDGVSLAVPRGSFFGLLGPNGAGKSTLINILAGLVRKSSGTAAVWGYDSVANERMARASIGVVPQELNLDPFFTPRELLEVQGGMYGVPKAERRTQEILAAVGLADKADAYARTLSGGMRRRLLVAKALVHSPPVLVLDEPTAGVDIELRQQLWAYVSELNRTGVTIVLTTHYLEEAEQLCDRIAIIDHGHVVAHDEKDALLRRLDSKILTITVDRDLTSVPAALASFRAEIKDPRHLVIHYQPSHASVGAVLDGLRTAGVGVVDLSTDEADLEDVFLRLTRGETSEPAGEAERARP
jgi:ABC-2 type transport system ATP-binding protein